MKKNILTQDNFKAWLTSKSPRTKVGVRENGDTPIQRFLAENNATTTNLPKWATTFNVKVASGKGKTISANAALSLLA